jgi:hypothetical protein
LTKHIDLLKFGLATTESLANDNDECGGMGLGMELVDTNNFDFQVDTRWPKISPVLVSTAFPDSPSGDALVPRICQNPDR